MQGTEVKTCNVPDCKKPASARGLCTGHYYHLRHGRDPARRADAERYALRKRKTNPGPERSEGPANDEPHELGDPDPENSEGTVADEAIAIVVDICSELGIRRLDTEGSHYFMNPANGRIVELTNKGLVYKAEIRRLPSS